ncbi:MAG: sugar transferase [Anaerolineales bacterium]|nr:sugar transferase [Anaerolineales bacterium]
MEVAAKSNESQVEPGVKALPGIFPLSLTARRLLITGVLLVLDALMLTLAFWLAYMIRFVILPYAGPLDVSAYVGIFLVSLPIWLVLFAAFQTYSRDYLFSGMGEYAQVFNAIAIGMLLLIVFGFFQRDGRVISRGWLLLAWTLSFLLVGGARFIFRRIVYALRKRGHLLSPALIVGANQEGLELGRQLSTWATSGLYLLGYVDDQVSDGEAVFENQRVLGGMEDLEQLVKERGIQEVIVAPTALSREQLLEIFRTFAPHPDVHLRLSSGLFEVVSSGMKVKELAYVPLIEFNAMRMSGWDMGLKLALDYALAIPLFLFLLPILGALGILVKLDSPGPAIYRRRVMGVNGAQFDALKFRTMCVDGDEILAQYPELQEELVREYKIKDDPRVTKLGRILRKYSLDELPQIINVLRNQMSLVGPRMISPPEMEKYGKWGMNLLTVKPGISGLWQISGRSEISYEERVRIDMEYIRNWTIWRDIYIIVRTPFVVLFSRGAY